MKMKRSLSGTRSSRTTQWGFNVGFEEDGYVRGLSYDEDSMREIEAEIEQERLDAIYGHSNDTDPAPVVDDDFYPDFEYDAEYAVQLRGVTLNGAPVFEDDELDKAFEANFHGKVIGVYDSLEEAQAAEDKAYEEEEEELRGKLHGIYTEEEA
jgi:hypothetical protein